MDPMYCNNVNIQVTNYDIILNFSYKSNAEQEAKLISIVMSPQHTKAFAHLLSEKVRKYEEIFGPLNLEAKIKKGNELEN
ncbi:MAG: hypothetical protein APF84_17885 [Gracilibacter sp. BRH_c7a]|nr:MAG: hypothetical protein APF84_17885 [Gracilibacter sp. BRH_c7a]